MENILGREVSIGIDLGDAIARRIATCGKRLRPRMMMLAFEAACGSTPSSGQALQRTALPSLAAAFELLHLASLLHDDVVDGAGMRRGKPSANAAWGAQAAVITGDVLWCRASLMVIRTGEQRLLEILAGAACAMAEGELLDIALRKGVVVDETAKLRMIQGKTASLFAAAAEAGGVLAVADAAVTEALRESGRLAGMAYQLADDARDISEDHRPITATNCSEMLLQHAGAYATRAARALEKIPASPARDTLASFIRSLVLL
jgi:octaprenyl-diphosphate synthase